MKHQIYKEAGALHICISKKRLGNWYGVIESNAVVDKITYFRTPYMQTRDEVIQLTNEWINRSIGWLQKLIVQVGE